MSKVADHYSGQVAFYRGQYDMADVRTHHEYPSELVRIELIRDRLKNNPPKRLLDIGIGEATPALILNDAFGCAIDGCDITQEMVDASKAALSERGLAADNITIADVEDESSLQTFYNAEPYDVAMALGVFPHVQDEVKGLRNIRKALKPGGRAFISFRNPLFSLFTMNRYTHQLIMEEMLADQPEEIKKAASDKLSGQMAMNMPLVREKNKKGGIGYDLILSQFHNPLNVGKFFEDAGFASHEILWYHYHPAAPYLEGNEIDKQTYRDAALAMEGRMDDWRGYFLCSAYVVEAVAG